MIKQALILIMLSCPLLMTSQTNQHKAQVELLTNQKSQLEQVDLDALQKKQATIKPAQNCATCPLNSKKEVIEISYTTTDRTIDQQIADKERIEQILRQMKAELPANRETYGKYLVAHRQIERAIQLSMASEKTKSASNSKSNRETSNK